MPPISARYRSNALSRGGKRPLASPCISVSLTSAIWALVIAEQFRRGPVVRQRHRPLPRRRGQSWCRTRQHAKSRLNRDGGLLLLSLEGLRTPCVTDKPRFNNQHVQDRPDGRRVVFQLWDWAKDAPQLPQPSVPDQRDRRPSMRSSTSRRSCRALLTRRNQWAAVRDASATRRFAGMSPEASGYYQPIVTARNV